MLDPMLDVVAQQCCSHLHRDQSINRVVQFKLISCKKIGRNCYVFLKLNKGVFEFQVIL